MKLFSGESGSVFRNMITLALGTGTARLIGLGAIPFLTRIYSPDDYGVLSVYTALVSVLAPLMTLRYALALPLPRRASTAINLLALSALVMASMCLVTSTGFWLFGSSILKMMSMQSLLPWQWLIVLGATALAVYETLTLWATRERRFGTIARSQVAQSLLGESLKLGLGLLSLKPLGLLLGHSASQSVGTVYLLRSFWPQISFGRHALRPSRIRLLAKHYLNFPVFRLPSQLLLVLATQGPVLLMATFFNAKITGQLGLALMSLSLPVALLGDSMSKAYYSEIASRGRKQPEALRRLTLAVIKRLFLLSIVPTVALLLFGEVIFIRAFGDQWNLAGTFASSLAIYLVFQFIQQPVSYIMFVFDGQKQLLLLNAQRVVLTFLCFVGGSTLNWGAVTIVRIYAVCMCLHYLISIALALSKIPHNKSKSLP